MKKVAYISLFAAIVLSAVVGCSGKNEDDKLGTAAAPPSPDAVAEPGRPNKNRPGAFGAVTGGGGAGAGQSGTNTLATKPPGM